ncbi:hypothetical protein Hanom_Chr14g01289891 [Helianthus anomalus]
MPSNLNQSMLLFNKKEIYQQVTKIPQKFSSLTDYTKSFIDPLLEETHAQLLSSINIISRASTCEIKVRSEKKVGSSLITTRIPYLWKTRVEVEIMSLRWEISLCDKCKTKMH